MPFGARRHLFLALHVMAFVTTGKGGADVMAEGNFAVFGFKARMFISMGLPWRPLAAASALGR